MPRIAQYGRHSSPVGGCRADDDPPAQRRAPVRERRKLLRHHRSDRAMRAGRGGGRNGPRNGDACFVQAKKARHHDARPAEQDQNPPSVVMLTAQLYGNAHDAWPAGDRDGRTPAVATPHNGHLMPALGGGHAAPRRGVKRAARRCKSPQTSEQLNNGRNLFSRARVSRKICCYPSRR